MCFFTDIKNKSSQINLEINSEFVIYYNKYLKIVLLVKLIFYQLQP